MCKKFLIGLFGALLLVVGFGLWNSGQKKLDQNVAIAAYTKLPLSFIKNEGQMDREVRYYLKGSEHSIFFSKNEIVYKASSVIRQRFIGANRSIMLRGSKELSGKVNYFVGKDRQNWKTNIPTYEEIVYQGLYPGIDVAFSGTQGQVKSEFRVAAGADYRKILVAYEGIDGLSLSDAGDVVIKSGPQKLKETKPYIYQMIDGKKVEIGGRYVVGRNQYGFELESYNPNHLLIIDPQIVFSTYLGGSKFDSAQGVAIDPLGHVYVTGFTGSSNFPTASPWQAEIAKEEDSNRIRRDVFVTKFNPSGSQLVFSTYLGGIKEDYGWGIAVDSSGNVYVAGGTDSIDFPTANPFQEEKGGGASWNDPGYSRKDAFVAKLNAGGSELIYSTYLGGSGDDEAWAIAIDAMSNAYITGNTSSRNASNDFPTTDSAYQPNYGGGYEFPKDFGDAFVAKFNSSGTDLIYSTYLGGNSHDEAHDIAIDASGNAYVTGFTRSSNFPTASPFQATLNGTGDAFVTKLNANGSAPVYSTYLGGSSSDSGDGIAVDASGNVYVTGMTGSFNFPLVSPIQTFNGGSLSASSDAFVSKLNPSGSALVYSTYLGGGQREVGHAITVDSSGNVSVTGETTSTNFPTNQPLQAQKGGGGWNTTDVFVTKLNASGSEFAYSTYLGGNSNEEGSDIAADAQGNVYVTGHTQSSGFPTVSAFQTSSGDGGWTAEGDVFVTKISPVTPQKVDLEKLKESLMKKSMEKWKELRTPKTKQKL